ncbi:MAG: SIMPL domain-containing protein [Acidobacteriaceae bacterium]
MTLLRRATLTTLFLGILPLSAQQIQISKDNKTIAITTSADADAPADTAVVTIGFNTYGKDQDTTYADASKTSNAIISAITSSDVKKDAIQSTEQNLSAINPADFQNKPRYEEGLRFQFSQSWRVTVPADQAADLLHLAITSGANNSGNIDWQLKNDDALQAEAAAKALHHAREIAEQMAQGLNTKLGALLYASNETPSDNVYIPRSVRMDKTAFGGLHAPTKIQPLAISPDRITRSATVYAVFAIE